MTSPTAERRLLGSWARGHVARNLVSALTIAFTVAWAVPAIAQPVPEPAPGTPLEAPAAAVAPPAEPDYFFPDLAAGSLVHDGERLRIKPIIAIVTDYTWFDQNDASLGQVGEQESRSDLRAGRIGVNVRSKGERQWVFTLTADYQEKRTREDATWQIYDLKFDIPIGPVNLTVGKQKEPFSFEMVGLFPTLPQQERILSPFFVTRNVGVQLSGLLAGDRMTWAAGAFNDWLEADAALNSNATDWVGRATGLPWVTPDNRSYLHLGMGLRHVGSDAGTMRFSGRPESNVADKYVDTGSFPADHAEQLSLELAWQRGPFALLGEHVDAWVDAPERGDPHFSGEYGLASWVVTGESRVYNRALGYAGGILPTRRFGAVELVLRYSHVNLMDAVIEGGDLDRWGVGVNWWLSAQWKFGVSYGDAELDKSGLRGTTRMLMARLQWMY